MAEPHVIDSLKKRRREITTEMRKLGTALAHIGATIKLMEPEHKEPPVRHASLKCALARWVNAELRRFGLALICPKSRRPSVLLADRGGIAGVGRFQVQSEDPDGRKVRAHSSATLPRLELTAASEEWAKSHADASKRNSESLFSSISPRISNCAS
jgi:hypothetical protein